MFTRIRILRFFLLPVALVGSLGATVAYAGGFGPGFGPPGLHHAMMLDHLEQLADELGLTDEQVDQIKTIADDARTHGKELHEANEGLRDEGIALFTAEVIDRKAIEKHRRAMMDAADEGSQLISDTLASIAEILTPEQRLALAEKAEQFHAAGGFRGRMRERWHGEGPGPR